MKIAHICHLSSSSGVSALPTNLNNELNKSENYIFTRSDWIAYFAAKKGNKVTITINLIKCEVAT